MLWNTTPKLQQQMTSPLKIQKKQEPIFYYQALPSRFSNSKKLSVYPKYSDNKCSISNVQHVGANMDYRDLSVRLKNLKKKINTLYNLILNQFDVLSPTEANELIHLTTSMR